MAEQPHPALTRLLAETDPAARERAWTALIAEHNRLLMHVARSFGGGYDAALDRYEYILEHLRRNDFRRLRAFAAEGRGLFSTWLVVVARRMCVDHHRHLYGRSERTLNASPSHGLHQNERRLLLQLTGSGNEDEADMVDERSNPDLSLRESELRDALEQALATLSAGDRLMLRLRLEDDVPAREVAEIMGLPTPFHVYRRMNAICERLRGELRRHGVEDPVP